jgi:hypothetical protein
MEDRVDVNKTVTVREPVRYKLLFIRKMTEYELGHIYGNPPIGFCVFFDRDILAEYEFSVCKCAVLMVKKYFWQEVKNLKYPGWRAMVTLCQSEISFAKNVVFITCDRNSAEAQERERNLKNENGALWQLGGSKTATGWNPDQSGRRKR